MDYEEYYNPLEEARYDAWMDDISDDEYEEYDEWQEHGFLNERDYWDWKGD